MAFKLRIDPRESSPDKKGFKLKRDPREFLSEKKEDPKGLIDKGIDLWRRTAQGNLQALNQVKEDLSGTNLVDLTVDTITDMKSGDSVLPPFPGQKIGKSLLSGFKKGFNSEEKIAGRDILKEIPELENEGEVSVSPFPTDLLPKKEKKGFQLAISPQEKARDKISEVLNVVSQLEEGRLGPSIAKIVQTLRQNPQSLIGKPSETALRSMMGQSVIGKAKPKTLVNLPKRASEFSIDVLADPLTPTLGLAGEGIGVLRHGISKASQVPAIANGLKFVVDKLKKIPGASTVVGFSKVFQRGGGDTQFVKLLDDMENNINRISAEAVKQARDIEKNLTPAQDKRLAQILRGGITNDPHMRAIAEPMKRTIDNLEFEAKKLKLLGDTFRTKLSKKQIAKLRTEQEQIAQKISRIKTGVQDKSKEKIINLANEVSVSGDTKLANRLLDITRGTQGISTSKKFSNIIEVIDQYKKLPARSKGRLINLVDKAENAVGSERFKIMRQIIDTVDEIDQLGVKGVKPLIREISRLTSRFPGQTKLIKQLEKRSDEVAKRIVTSYTQGGRGYLPRLYTIFESGMARELAKKGVSIDDLIALGDDQLAAITSLTDNEFKTFINLISKKNFPNARSSLKRISGTRFMRRKDLSLEMKQALGEIETASYPYARGVHQVARDVEHAKFFETVSKNKKWAMTPDEFMKSGNSQLKWMKMPDSKRLGTLRNMMVRRDVALDILGTTRVSGPIARQWAKAMGLWKFGKVIINPSTHFRNFFSNSILMDLSGVDPLEQLWLLPKAGRELLNKGKYYDEMQSSGLLNTGFIDNEIKKFLPSFMGTKGPSMSRHIKQTQSFMEEAGNIYQSEEMLFKAAKFIHMRQKGASVAKATAEAEKWLFNYNKLAPATRVLRQMPFGSPFITFTAKALPRIAEVAVNNPAKLYKYKAMFNAIEDQAKEKLGLDDDDIKNIKKTFRGTGLVLPTKDIEGNPMVLDLSYILPWGDIGETGGFFGLPNAVPPGGPLMAVMEAGFDKSLFTGQEIREPLEPWYIDWADTADFLAKAILPSFAPGVNIRESPIRGGYSYDKMVSAVMRKPDGRGRIRNMAWTFSDIVFGIKAFPIDPNEQMAFKAMALDRKIQKAMYQEKKLHNHKGISEEERARSRMRLIKTIRQRAEELRK